MTEKAKARQAKALELAAKTQGKAGGLLERLAGKATNRFWAIEIAQAQAQAKKNAVKDHLLVGLLH